MQLEVSEQFSKVGCSVGLRQVTSVSVYSVRRCQRLSECCVAWIHGWTVYHVNDVSWVNKDNACTHYLTEPMYDVRLLGFEPGSQNVVVLCLVSLWS